MTTQTRQLGDTTDAQGNHATLNYSYDDVTLLISQIAIVNNTVQSVFASAKRIDGSKTYSTTVAAGQSQTIPIASNQASRLQLTVTPSGKLDGVEWAFYLL